MTFDEILQHSVADPMLENDADSVVFGFCVE